jgi:ribosomal protein L2
VAIASSAELWSSSGKDGDYSYKMPSNDVHLIRKEFLATIGQVCNIEHKSGAYRKKAGESRESIRPTVRGVL